MEMNYEPQIINARMGLREVLKEYSNDIYIITLKDGTNIEIVQDNQQFRGKGSQEMNYIDNRILPDEGNYDDFVEENIMEGNENLNYQQIPSNYPGPLRGRGLKKTLGKSLRKTVLKSIDGTEQEAKVQTNEKLRFFNKNRAIPSLNNIIQHTENNDYLQCANCKRFFFSDEKEEQNINQASNKQSQNEIINNQQISPQIQQYQQITPQKLPQNNHNHVYPNQPQNFPQQVHQHQNQPQPFNQYGYPSQHNTPHNHKQQKIPFGYSPNPGQPQPFPHQVQPSHKHQQQYYQQIPIQKQYIQQQYYAQNDSSGGYGSQGNYPRSNQPMAFQYQGQNNFVFRSKKKESNRYNSNNSFSTQGNYFFSSSAKKQSGEIPMPRKLAHNMSNENLNNNITRKLSYGFKKHISNEIDNGLNNNNLTEYMGMNNINYYEFPPQKKNKIPTGNIMRKFNKNKFSKVKMTTNQYQDEEVYYY